MDAQLRKLERQVSTGEIPASTLKDARYRARLCPGCGDKPLNDGHPRSCTLMPGQEVVECCCWDCYTTAVRDGTAKVVCDYCPHRNQVQDSMPDEMRKIVQGLWEQRDG